MLWNGGDTVENLGRAGKFDRSDLMIMMSADPEAERAKYEADKAAATQRHDTEKRREVAVEFKRVQLMKQSYGALKNKKSDSAERLRFKLEQAKTKLANNKYFTAKEALSSKTDVVLDPDTGTAIMAGVGLNIDEKDGSTVKWVVTGVNAVTGDVTMRRWGELGRNSLAMTVSSSKLSGGVKPYQFDAAEEGAHVKAKLEEEAAAKMNSLTDWQDVKAMPSSVLEANHDLIQRQIKEGAKSYKFHIPYGDVPMINKETGELKMAASYEHTKLHDTHDYLLPTDAAKDRVARAWMDSERGKVFGRTTYQARKNSRTEWRHQTEYPDAQYNSRTRNPWTSLLSDLGGDRPAGSEAQIVRDTAARFRAEQLERVRRAPTFKDALSEAFPMATMSEYGGDEKTRPKWDKKALAVLWARARHEGLLNSDIGEYVPKKTSSNGYTSKIHDGYAHYRPGYVGADNTVHGTLHDIAVGSGHKDLAEAMVSSSKRIKDIKEAA